MNGRRLNRGSYTHSVHVNRNDRWRGTKKLCKYKSNEIKESIEKNRATARIFIVSILRRSKRKLETHVTVKMDYKRCCSIHDIEITILCKTAIVEFLFAARMILFLYKTRREFTFKQRSGWWKLHDKKIDDGNYANRRSVKSRRKLRILSGILSFVGFIFNRYLVLLCSIAANRTSTLEASPYISKYINERKSLFQC